MMYLNEINDVLAKLITLFCSTCSYVYMTKLEFFYVWAFCHMTYKYDSPILSKQTWAYFRHILCCDVMYRALTWCWRHEKKCLEINSNFPLRCYANCVSTRLMVLITLKVSISVIVTKLHNIESYSFHI
jgi:hypothetical protein